MKSFTTTQDMAQYEVSQDYCEPYLGATHDDLQAARFNKYDTHIDKNEFFVYDNVNHKYNIYRRVEYIENPSNAYINTGITGSMDLNFYIEFLPTELATAYKSGAGSIFGSRSAYNSRAYQLTTYNKVSPYDAAKRGHFLCANNYGWSNNKAPTANMLLNQKNIIKKENLIFTRADGSTFTLTSQTFTTAATIRIFQCAGAGEPAKIKLYKLQFSKNGNILRDFIPVKNTLTNQYGLLDTVEQKFYVSPNGVEFNGGNEIIEDKDGVQYRRKEYIENTSTAYIDTNIIASLNISYELKAKRTTINNGSGSIFGWRGTNQAYYLSLNSNNTVYVFHSNLYGNVSTTTNTFNIHTYAMKNGLFYIDNVLIADKTSATAKTGANIYLCRYNNNTTPASTIFYYCKIWNSNILVRDYIPVQRIQDNVYGFFDNITKTFNSSLDSVQFTGG